MYLHWGCTLIYRPLSFPLDPWVLIVIAKVCCVLCNKHKNKITYMCSIHIINKDNNNQTFILIKEIFNDPVIKVTGCLSVFVAKAF